jgi:hypothetical protein
LTYAATRRARRQHARLVERLSALSKSARRVAQPEFHEARVHCVRDGHAALSNDIEQSIRAFDGLQRVIEQSQAHLEECLIRERHRQPALIAQRLEGLERLFELGQCEVEISEPSGGHRDARTGVCFHVAVTDRGRNRQHLVAQRLRRRVLLA